jgi:hypothetical protein
MGRSAPQVTLLAGMRLSRISGICSAERAFS